MADNTTTEPVTTTQDSAARVAFDLALQDHRRATIDDPPAELADRRQSFRPITIANIKPVGGEAQRPARNCGSAQRRAFLIRRSRELLRPRPRVLFER